MSDVPFENSKQDLFLPVLAPVYDKLAQPMAWSIFRLAVGGMLTIEGWPKIMAPLAQVGFVQSLGFYPGWLWSPFLAGLQFFGGMFIAVGLFTRPIALANAVMLAITLWFHYSHPYPAMILTPEGIAALKTTAAPFIDPAIAARLADGGAAFMAQIQDKAILASLFWTGGAFLYAAFGGGYLSLDKLLFKREF